MILFFAFFAVQISRLAVNPKRWTMPLYDFVCADCGARREVRADYETKSNLELLCVHCGGVMRAAPASGVAIITTTAKQEEQLSSPQTKSDGHTYACSSAIKLARPNPFAKEIEHALHGTRRD